MTPRRTWVPTPGGSLPDPSSCSCCTSHTAAPESFSLQGKAKHALVGKPAGAAVLIAEIRERTSIRAMPHTLHPSGMDHSPSRRGFPPQVYECLREKGAVMGSGRAGVGCAGNWCPYHPLGTRPCGRTGTWRAGPRSTCRRAGAWGCHSGGRRTAPHHHSSGSRSPRGSTGPSRHPPPAARDRRSCWVHPCARPSPCSTAEIPPCVTRQTLPQQSTSREVQALSDMG